MNQSDSQEQLPANDGEIQIHLTTNAINEQELLHSVKDRNCGAVVLFLGVVREFTEGQQTKSLYYEAYDEMAVSQMRRLAEEAQQRWGLRRISIVHRLGPLELEEVAIGIAVSSPHRPAAFDATSYLMDQIKKSVPIWKQEHWADGSTEWVHPDAPG